MSITQSPPDRLARLALATVMAGAFMSLLDKTYPGANMTDPLPDGARQGIRV
ncbi:MAG: hypothetical protein ACRDPY_24185 [Streptosporangiaceae bacterium]